MTDRKWETYEEVAVYLLNEFANEFGLDTVERKQKVRGKKSGTNWVIDGKGFKKDGVGFVIVECRRYTTSKQNQEKVGGLAYRIYDTGAEGGILVSPLGLQSGAELVANAENVVSVKITPESSTNNYVMSFLNKVMVSLTDQVSVSDSIHSQVIRNGEILDE
ncbi:MAG: hypothetical protein AB2687_22705 [Candidatus Thiodiazotropha taylori]